jgi:hypothetical protein
VLSLLHAIDRSTVKGCRDYAMDRHLWSSRERGRQPGPRRHSVASPHDSCAATQGRRAPGLAAHR